MVTRKMHIAFFIVVMLFFTHSLMLSLTSTLLILFLADFATMSMSTDNVRSSLKPDKFSMRTLFVTGVSLGVLFSRFVKIAIAVVISGSIFACYAVLKKKMNTKLNRFSLQVRTGLD